MADTDDRAHDLDYLGGKVYQAKELISRLRESNRALSSRLGEVEQRLQAAEAASQQTAPPSDGDTASIEPANQELAVEVERLRQQRREIRKRVSQLLERIESLDL